MSEIKDGGPAAPQSAQQEPSEAEWVSQQWRPAKTQSVSFWCHRCNRQRMRSRIDGKCPFCRSAG